MSHAPNRPCERLPVALLALVLHACASPGGTNPTGTGMPAAAGPAANGGEAAMSRESARADNDAPAGAEKPAATEDGSTRRIEPNDLLKIEVAQAAELSSEGRVGKAGAIVMPLVGEVRVGGLTPKEAERRIAEILGKDYLQDPKVSVVVAE